MKTDRLIGILSLLLQQEKCTIGSLSEQFEVSRRTVSRDIQTLCAAGIPVCTVSGQNGGVSIMDGYTIDRTLLTKADMQAIFTGLKGLDSVCGTKKYRQLMGKLSVVEQPPRYIDIDLGSWYKSSLVPKISQVLAAIEAGELLSFTYYAPERESTRTIEPYRMVFRWASWYLWGFCTSRNDFRLFKLNRMQELKETGHRFTPRQLPPFDCDAASIYPETVQASVLFDTSAKWRLIEQAGPESFSTQPDGRLLFRSGFADKNSLFGFLLGFGLEAELTEPLELRMEYGRLLHEMAEKYENEVFSKVR
jgi:predicted DNA-binding transcriptional regulator YafY